MFKKILSLIVAAVLFSNTNLIAQVTPDGILFQAIAKDANGNGAAGRNIYAKVNLLKGSSTGTSVYAETFKVVSTDEGIFTIVIGKGTRTSGVTNLKAILWNEALYFVNIQIAIEPTVPGIGWNADNNYVDMGTSQLWTVPYALFSSKATVADSAMSISTIVPGSKGGTGVNNDGKTITLGQNLTFKGIGDITITTTGVSNISLPTTGLLANTQYVSDRIGTDTVSLSNRINAINLSTINSSALKLNIDDTAAMLGTYLRKIDTFSLSTRINVNKQSIIDSAIALNARKVNVADTALMLSNRFARDTASLSSRINLKVNIADTALMLSNRFARDTASLSSRIDRNALTMIDSARVMNLRKVNYTDTALMLSPYANRSNTVASIDAEKARALAAENLKLNIADTLSMLSNFYNKTATDARLNLKLNNTDTVTMLSPYAIRSNTEASINAEKARAIAAEDLKVNIADTTLMLSPYAIRSNTETSINRKLNIADTALMLSPYAIRSNTEASIDAEKLRAIAAENLKVKYADTASILSPYAIRSNTIASINAEKARAIAAEDLKVNIADTSLMLSPYAIRANTEASIDAKVNIIDTAGMLSKYYNKTATDSRLEFKVNFTDTATMLTPYAIRSNTVASINAEKTRATTAENLKVNIADTTNMLSNYAIRVNTEASIDAKLNITDTTGMLSKYYNKTATDSKLELKVNFSDTSNMLSPYAIRSNTIASINAEKTRATTAENLKVNIADTSNMLAPYAIRTNTEESIITKLNIADTANMLSSYYNKTAADARLNLKMNLADTSNMLSAYAIRSNTIASINAEKSRAITAENLKLNIADTTNMLSAYAIRSNTEASINTKVNIIDTTNMLSAYAIRSNTEASINTKLNITDTASILAPYAIRSNTEASINAEKSRAMTAENLRVKYSDTTLMLSTYANLSNTEASINTKLNITDTASMLSSYYNKTAADARLNLKTNLADTSAMLSAYAIRSNTIASINAEKSRAITAENLKLNIADTTNMLSAYAIRSNTEESINTKVNIIDTTNMLSAYAIRSNTEASINTKLNIADTASILSPYAIRSNTEASINAEKSRAMTAENLRVKYSDTTNMLSAYAIRSNTEASINTKLNIADTASMLSNYYNITAADARLNLKTNLADTAAMLLPYAIRSNTVASLNLKAPLASPELTGTPKAPTAAAGTNTTQIATTAFVAASITNGATPDATTISKGKLQLANDLGGTADLPTVTSVGGSSASSINTGVVLANAATASNTNNTIVKRNTSGDFSAGTITANLLGTSTNVTGIVVGANGGTGIDNSGKTITLGGNVNTGAGFTTTGTTGAGNAADITLKTTGATELTLPLTGTLATLTGVEALTNKTINGITPTSAANGFTLAGGTASKTLTVNNNATVSGTNTGDQTITLSGDVTGTGAGSFSTTLASSGVTAGAYGSATVVPTITVDAKGRVTNVANTTISGVSPVGSAMGSGKIIVGNALGVASIVDMSGDVTIDNLGVTTIGNNKITTDKVLNSNITYSKIQDVTTGTVLGRTSANNGIVEEIATIGTGDVVRAISPTFTGAPQVPTPLATSNNGTIANTEFVRRAISNIDANAVDGIISGAKGGTGVANTDKTITLGGNFATNGANSLMFTTTGATNVTVPTSGTLATVAQLDAIQGGTFSGGQITGIVAPANGGTGIDNTGKTITLGGSLLTGAAFTTTGTTGAGNAAAITLKTTAATDLTLPTTGTLATLNGTETLTNKTITASANSISGLTNTNLSGAAGITDANLATISTAGKIANTATTATNANTINAIVSRDGSGNFIAGTITAALAGNAATATKLETQRSIYGNNFDGSANLSQVITPAYGGTGNAYTKFTGATTSEKLYNLPDANTTILTTNALITPAQGGTGVATAAMNTFFAGPISGSDAAPSFRALSASDLPAGNGSYIANSTTQQSNSNFNISGAGIAAGSLTAGSFIKKDGTSAQFLKADGTVDSRSFATLAGSETLTNKTINGVTPTAVTTGFTLAGGLTNNKTLTVAADANVSGTNTGDVALSGQDYLTISNQTITAAPVNLAGANATGILAAARFPALTGDVTNLAGAVATTISNDAITSTKIADNAVTNTKIADNAVSETKIANGAVSMSKIAPLSIQTLLGNKSNSAASAPGEITIGTGLSLNPTSGVLSASGSGGTVSNVSALTVTASGSTLSSTVANATSTPVISLNIPLASVTGTTAGLISKSDYDAFNAKTTANAAITGATKTKITYDAKGLVTSGANATTADIAASTDKNYVTDAQAVVIANTSGTNTGDQTITLTGAVTGTGSGSFTTTLSNAAVTYAKIQNMNSKTLIGNKSLTAGVPGEITLGSGLALNETTGVLSASGTGGTVSNVSALTFGTTGTDVTSTVTNSSSTPVITLNIPTASATNRGALSAADWTTFNSKQSSIPLKFKSGTSGGGVNIGISPTDGHDALGRAANTGYNNIAIGSNAMGSYYLAHLTGWHNVAIGTDAGGRNASGSGNLFLGSSTGMNNYDGTNNTFVGYLADVNVDNPSPLYNNATALGYNAKVTGSNKIQLGDANILNVNTSGTITAGNVTYPKVDGSNGQVLVTNGSGVATFKTIDVAGANLTDGKILVGNASNVATAVSVSGDITMTNAGVTSIAAGAVATADIAAAAVTYAKIQNMSSKTLIGNKSLTAGVPGEITLGTGLALDESTGVLSASGSGGTVSGTGAVGQLPYWSSTTGLAGNPNFTWDNTNKIAKIGQGVNHVNVDYEQNAVMTTTPVLSVVGKLNDATEQTLLRLKRGHNQGGSYAALFDFVSTGGANKSQLDIRLNTPLNNNYVTLLTLENINGNVGINNTAPSEKLDVAGNLKFSGALKPNNLAGSIGQVLTSQGGSSAPTWVTPSTGIGGSGTASYIPKFNASTTVLGNSLIFDDGTSVLINSNNSTVAGGSALLVSNGNNFAPVTTGTTQTGGALRIRGGDNTVIDFGTVSTKPWIQSGSSSGLQTTYPLYINPNGGTVAIGLGTASATSTSKLQVNGDVGATTFNSVGLKMNTNKSIVVGSGAPSVTGGNNISIGEGTLNTITTAGENIAIGYQSMYKTNTEENTAVGHMSMFENTGRYNTAIGFKAGYDNTSGYYNTSGDYNTFLGYKATASLGNLTNATAIGNGAVVNASNTIQLGNTSVTSVKTSGALNAPVYSSSPVALTAGSTITWAPMLGLNASVTLNTNSTLSFGATPPPAGSSGTLIVTQPASGGTYTLALPSGGTHKVLGSASGITLSTTNSAKDIVSFYYDGSIYYWNVGLGYGNAQSLSANSLTGGVAGAIPYQTALSTTGFTDAGTAGYYLTSQGTGKPTWTAPTTGIGGSGTASYIPRFNGSTTILGNSSLTDDGTGLRIGNSNGQTGIYTGLNSDNNTRLMVTGGREYESIKMSFPGDPYNNELSFNWYSSAWRMRTERSSAEITDLSFWRTSGGTTTEQMRLTSAGNLNITGAIKTGAITYPSTAGTNGYILTTNGSNTASWTAPSFVDLSSAQTVAGIKTFSALSTVVNNNLTVNAAGTSGQGITLSDDGDFVDNNDGFGTFRFTGGIKINSNKGTLGTATNITLASGGNITTNGGITATSIKLTSGASNGYILTSSADGTASWAASASSISGGTQHALPKYTSATAIGPSAISDDGTTVSLASTRTLTGANAAVNAQTGTTYTLLQSDNGRVVTMSNASAITLTIPANLTAGFNCMIVQYGAGTVTIVGSGVTVVNRSNYTKTGGQYAIVTIVSPVLNTFITGGDMQ